MLTRLYTIKDLTSILKLSAFTIRKKIRERKLPGYKVGKQYLVKESDLIKYINDLTDTTNKN